MLPVVEPTPPDAYLTHSSRVGAHELFVVSAPSIDVRCRTTLFEDSLKLISPRKGTVSIEQEGRAIHLKEGQVGLVSLEQSFRFRAVAPAGGPSDLVQWRLPRDLVTQRHPGWRSGGLRSIGDGSQGESVLAGLLSAFISSCAQLSKRETAVSLAALVEALGLLSSPRESSVEEMRVRRASEAIQQRLHESALTPESIAREQGVSRRYLDALFKRLEKRSLSAAIRDSRLERAAQTLRTQSDLKLLTLALSLGFENQSHFARRFKQRFGVSPTQYRTG